jgi:hypothetical protein
MMKCRACEGESDSLLLGMCPSCRAVLSPTLTERDIDNIWREAKEAWEGISSLDKNKKKWKNIIFFENVEDDRAFQQILMERLMEVSTALKQVQETIFPEEKK